MLKNRWLNIEGICSAFLFIIAAFLAVWCVLYKAPFVSFLVVLAYNIFFILLPGAAISSYFMKSISLLNDSIIYLGLSYAIGYSLNIVFYFLFFSLGIQSFAIYISILISIISICIVVTHYKRRQYVDIAVEKKTAIGVLAFFVLFLALSTVLYIIQYVTPNVIQASSVNNDILFWINNSISLSYGYPCDSIMCFGPLLKYHLFSSAQVALMNAVTRIDIVTLSLCFYKVIPATLLIGGSYCLAKSCTKKPKLIFAFIFIAVFTTGIEKQSIITYASNMLIAPFGFDIAQAFLMYAASLIIFQNSVSFSKGALILIILFLSITTGSKGSTGVVLLGFIGLLCLYWLFKKHYKKAILYGTFSIFCFLFIYLFIVSGNNAQLSTATQSISFGAIAINSVVLLDIYKRLLCVGIPQIIIFIIISVLWFIAINPILLFLTVYTLWSCRIKKEYRYFSIIPNISLIVGIFGIILTVTLDFIGSSQMYFAMSSTIFILIFCIYILDKIITIRKDKISSQALYLVIISVILYCFSYGFVGTASICYDNIQAMVTGEVPRYFSKYDYYGFDDSTYQAMLWIKTNLPQEAKFVSDAVNGENSLARYYPAFSERKYYANDTSYNMPPYEYERRKELVKCLYSGDHSAVEQIYGEGVTYIVQTYKITPTLQFDDNCTEMVFNNDRIAVYKVKNLH